MRRELTGQGMRIVDAKKQLECSHEGRTALGALCSSAEAFLKAGNAQGNEKITLRGQGVSQFFTSHSYAQELPDNRVAYDVCTKELGMAPSAQINEFRYRKNRAFFEKEYMDIDEDRTAQERAVDWQIDIHQHQSSAQRLGSHDAAVAASESARRLQPIPKTLEDVLRIKTGYDLRAILQLILRNATRIVDEDRVSRDTYAALGENISFFLSKIESNVGTEHASASESILWDEIGIRRDVRFDETIWTPQEGVMPVRQQLDVLTLKSTEKHVALGMVEWLREKMRLLVKGTPS